MAEQHSQAEVREIELDENTIRLDLTPVEAAAARLRRIEVDAKLVMRDTLVTHRKRGQAPGGWPDTENPSSGVLR